MTGNNQHGFTKVLLIASMIKQLDEAVDEGEQ